MRLFDRAVTHMCQLFSGRHTIDHENAVLLETGGTSIKKRAKCPLFNDFCVPVLAWDKGGTSRDSGTFPGYFKLRTYG
jgi:hypothetical protein